MTNLLLLHELGVRAVVHDILAKDGRAERSIDFLGIHILEFAIEYEVVSLGAKTDGRLPSKENKGENIAILRPVSSPGTTR